MSFLSPSEGSTWQEREADKDKLCSSHNSKRKRASWPNINPAMNRLHKHSYRVSILCTLLQHCSDFKCPAAISSNLAEQSTGVIHLKFVVLGMMVQHEKTDQTAETCTNSTPKTTNELLFFTHQEETETPSSAARCYYSKYKYSPLITVVYYAECDTGYSHTSSPTPAGKHTVCLKCHLQCSEGVDEKDSLYKFWQIYQQT